MIKMRKNYNGDFITSIFIKVVRFKMSRKVSTEIVYQQLSENCIFMVSTFEYKCFENVHKILEKSGNQYRYQDFQNDSYSS